MSERGGPVWHVGSGATDTGQRKANEDAFLAQAPVYIVSDGMGGHYAGAAASAAVVDAFAVLVDDHAVVPEQVTDAVHRARFGVAEVSARAGGESGATLTGAVAVTHDGQPWWFVINVGDSRVYSLDGGVMAQITVDHSRVQELVDSGRITVEQSLVHPERNIITRAIGDEIPGCDAWLVPARPGMRLIVASDGLMKPLSDAQIASIASLAGTPEDTARRLVDAAVEAGAQDNVTVVVADTLHATTSPHANASPWQRWPVGDDFEDDTTQASRRKVAP
ncbi:PP2C family protein-serine/threonine phosphatase [Demequina oxidasica]|uniref:PP2C family protein-serine/threonine phosphatase n=1 Tax=Demequina oxidasica TaxID=676199 RepID=UPI000B11A729|nr:protein phosphatase 2C domain-containing protein [Demequina oxidasica]